MRRAFCVVRQSLVPCKGLNMNSKASRAFPDDPRRRTCDQGLADSRDLMADDALPTPKSQRPTTFFLC